MKSLLALPLVLLLLIGCQSRSTPAAASGDEASAGEATPAKAPLAARGLTNRVWTRADSTGLPGVMLVFLSDGTLLMDSCWETYRLVHWRTESDSLIAWQEDGMDIRAAIVELGTDNLVLRLDMSDSQDQHYRSAAVPYTCPDMKR